MAFNPRGPGDESLVQGAYRQATTGTSYPRHAVSGYTLAGVEVCTFFDPNGTVSSDVFIVGWECESDPLNPRNYSTATRLGATLVVSCIAIVVGAASSINAAVLLRKSEAFHVSEVVGSLATGKFFYIFAPAER
jgi:hypothetical protein